VVVHRGVAGAVVLLLVAATMSSGGSGLRWQPPLPIAPELNVSVTPAEAPRLAITRSGSSCGGGVEAPAGSCGDAVGGGSGSSSGGVGGSSGGGGRGSSGSSSG
jgi:hypothetical protein